MELEPEEDEMDIGVVPMQQQKKEEDKDEMEVTTPTTTTPLNPQNRILVPGRSAKETEQFFDIKTRKNIKTDYNNVEHLKAIAKKTHADIFLPSDSPVFADERVTRDLKDRVLFVPFEDWPEFSSVTNVLGFGKQLKEKRKELELVVEKFLATLGVLDIPIHAPILYMLICQDKTTAIVPSSVVLGAYFLTLSRMKSMPIFNSNLSMSLGYFRECLETDTFKREEFDEWIAHCTEKKIPDFILDSKGKQVPTPPQRVWTPEEIIDGKFPEEFTTRLQSVAMYKGAPWRQKDVVTKDDVIDAHMATKQKNFCEYIAKAHGIFENTQEEISLDKFTKEKNQLFVALHSAYVITLIREYEVAILNLLDQSCLSHYNFGTQALSLDGKIIDMTKAVGVPMGMMDPRRKAVLFCQGEIPGTALHTTDSNSKKEYIEEAIPDDVKRVLNENRSAVTTVRNAAIHTPQYDEFFPDSHLGTPKQYFSLLLYLQFFDKNGVFDVTHFPEYKDALANNKDIDKSKLVIDVTNKFHETVELHIKQIQIKRRELVDKKIKKMKKDSERSSKKKRQEEDQERRKKKH
jgi:hypothetical protein